MEEVGRPKVSILYNARDVTADLLPYLSSVEYVDKTEGESDTINVALTDNDGRFVGTWHPEKGDTLELFFGYERNLVPAGVFEIDQVEVSGPPRRVTLMGLAAPVSKSLRTLKSYAHENSSLAKIAATVAENNGLTVEGSIDPNLVLQRSTQSRETDLGYLYRLASSLGYGFNVRDTRLIFYKYSELETQAAKQTIPLSSVISYAFKNKTVEVYSSARLRYHNPDNQNTQTFESSAAEPASSDVLEVYAKAKTPAVAEAKTEAALHRKNSTKVTGTLVLPGDTALLAGNNIEVTEAGVYSGRYHIVSSRHSLTPTGGFGTTIELKKV